MNNKKYIISGILLLVLGISGGVFYYLYPAVASSIFSDGSDATVLASDVDISTSTDVVLPSSTDEFVEDQTAAPKKVSQPTVASKKSSENKNTAITTTQKNNDTDTDDIISSDSSSSSIVGDVPLASANISAPSCLFPATGSAAQSKQIILNEVAWMGSASSSNAEWMEIKNISGSDVDLNGWQLVNASGKIKISFVSGDTVSSGGLLLLSRSGSSSTVGKSYSGSLVNSGDILAIMDPQCNVSDFLDASSGWPAGNNTTKQTLERDADGIGWHTSALAGGTPGAENSTITPPIPKITSSTVGNFVTPQMPLSNQNTINVSTPSITTAATTTSTTDLVATSSDSAVGATTASSSSSTSSAVTSGHILIVTVQIAGASSTNDLIKLYNPTNTSIDVSGWKLHKRSQTGTEYSLKELPMGSVIQAGQSFTWANSVNGFSETVGANVSSTETLSADNSAALLDTTGAVVDAVAWGSGTNQFGKGSPYPTDPTGAQLLVRQSNNGTMVDTSNNANDFILQ
jgi:hypothetical protein